MSRNGALRVCFVAGNAYPLLADRRDLPIIGGAEVQQQAIASALQRRGVEVSFVTEDFGQGPETVHGGTRVLSYSFGRNKLRQGITLWRALSRAGADVYYVRGMPRFLGLLMLYCISRGSPLVLAMSVNQMVHPGHRLGFSLPHRLVYRLALSFAGAVVAQTEHQRALLSRNYGVRNAVVIPNGATPPPPGGAGGASRDRVLWVATLHRRKGVEVVFDLAARCPGLRFEIVGGPGRGTESFYEEARARASAFSNLRWTGHVSHREIDAVFSGSLALVNTTVAEQGVPNLHEGFPNVYLEAWRNGVPTLTLDNDPDDVICRNGLGFHSRTAERMALDLERLASSPELRERIGEAARAYVEREHGMERVADAYLALFQRLAGRA